MGLLRVAKCGVIEDQLEANHEPLEFEDLADAQGLNNYWSFQ
jgi:hypothetical protein